MDFLLKIDLSIFAILLLIALLLVVLVKRDLDSVRGKIFRRIIMMTIIMNILEILAWTFDGSKGEFYYILNFTLNFFFTALNTVIVSLWMCYIDYYIYQDLKRLKRRWFYLHPSIIVGVLSIINIFHPILFVIDDANVYSRLPLIWISITMTILIYIYSLLLVFSNRSRLASKVLYGVLLFLALPMLAAIAQLWIYGLLLMWPTTAIALVFSYLIFETTSSGRDFLTGAFTRRRAEEFITMLYDRKRQFSAIMIDLDDFKGVNDTYGHHVGDDMLVEMTRILKLVFSSKSLVSRYGGDEFLVIIEDDNSDDMQLFRSQIETHLLNSSNKYAQALKFSFGVAFCDNFEKISIKSIITNADNNMYLDKARNKNLKRRSDDR